MAKASKPNPGKTQGRRKAPESTSAQLPIRISLDREALNALDKRAIAAQIEIGIAAGWLVGGFLLERSGTDLGIRNQTANRITTATIGAISRSSSPPCRLITPGAFTG
ncbi:hypothetical protein [Microvirga sp. VF16]|uniref:hypothetical protein n=1 Tax=Microvirga sp. VF16 TaxID=2807101 RepID=UPI00193D1515|nr:hypothetical protein [Microvirga sp. VF16]QRM35534.1 hypothetical protein JO965_45205 [Microvirga sp. VF16]